MNLYSFSQQNNDEMGIYVTKENDSELYKDIFNEAQRLLTISEEIRVTVKKVDKEATEQINHNEKPVLEKRVDYSKSSFKTTKELSELTNISSRKINEWLVGQKLMYKKNEDWFTTKKGAEFGGISKEGQYGKFIVWPEEIMKFMK